MSEKFTPEWIAEQKLIVETYAAQSNPHHHHVYSEISSFREAKETILDNYPFAINEIERSHAEIERLQSVNAEKEAECLLLTGAVKDLMRAVGSPWEQPFIKSLKAAIAKATAKDAEIARLKEQRARLVEAGDRLATCYVGYATIFVTESQNARWDEWKAIKAEIEKEG
ncbi:MAG: hypothetical protein VB108_01270 [Anaerolineaceae bacterium]|nr:hypothetical protein [Anaerolineaceae bacterium]